MESFFFFIISWPSSKYQDMFQTNNRFY